LRDGDEAKRSTPTPEQLSHIIMGEVKMKKLLTFMLVAALVLAMAIPSMAAEKIDKKTYDSFSGKKSANNAIVEIGNGLKLISDSKTGWIIRAEDPDVKGTLEVAYKISSEYFIVAFEINGVGDHYIGDGSGNNGVNHCKIGSFVADKPPYPSV